MKNINGIERYCKVSHGGVKHFYISPYVGYKYKDIIVSGNNLVSIPDSNFYKFNCKGNYSQDSSVDSGGYFFNQKISLSIYKAYEFNEIIDFLSQDYRVIVVTNNGFSLMFGAHNGLTASISNASGSSLGEFSGLNVNFDGKEETAALYISDIDNIGVTLI